MWKICEKAQFPQSFGPIRQNETMPFQKKFNTRKLGKTTGVSCSDRILIKKPN